MKETKSFLRKISLIFLFSLISIPIGYFLRVLLSHSLSKVDYGLFYSVFAFYGLLTLIKNPGITQSLTKYLAEFITKREFGKAKFIFITTLLTRLLLATFAFLGVYLFSSFLSQNLFHTPKASIILFIVGMGWITEVIRNSLQSLLSGYQKPEYSSLANLLWVSFMLSYSYLFLFFGYGYLSPAFAYLFSHISVDVILYLFCNFKFRKFFRARYKRYFGIYISVLKYGIAILLGTISGTIIGYTDTVLLTLFTSLETVAIYTIAQPTARLLWLFSNAITAAFYPYTVKLFTDKKIRELSSLITLLLKYLLFVLVPFFIMLFSFSKEVLVFFFGPSYADGATVLKILSIGAIMYSLASIFLTFLNGIGKAPFASRIVFAGAILNLFGNLLLIPGFGMLGAATSTLFTYLLILILSCSQVSKEISFSLPLKSWLTYFFSGVLSSFSIFALKPFFASFLLKVVVCFSGFILLYLTICFVLKGVSREELLKILKLLIG